MLIHGSGGEARINDVDSMNGVETVSNLTMDGQNMFFFIADIFEILLFKFMKL